MHYGVLENRLRIFSEGIMKRAEETDPSLWRVIVKHPQDPLYGAPTALWLCSMQEQGKEVSLGAQKYSMMLYSILSREWLYSLSKMTSC